MGTLAKKAAAQGIDVVLVTADKDMFQLVGDGVALWHSGRTKLYDRQLVEEDFGVPPEQVADVLALMGDAVDNVPGVPGIGEKGAKALIREYGSVEALLERSCRADPQGLSRRARAAPRAGAAVERAHHHPHRPAGRPPPRQPAPRAAGHRGAAPALRRARVPHPRRGARRQRRDGARGRGARAGRGRERAGARRARAGARRRGRRRAGAGRGAGRDRARRTRRRRRCSPTCGARASERRCASWSWRWSPTRRGSWSGTTSRSSCAWRRAPGASRRGRRAST